MSVFQGKKEEDIVLHAASFIKANIANTANSRMYMLMVSCK